jgi:hypothetical protein
VKNKLNVEIFNVTDLSLLLHLVCFFVASACACLLSTASLSADAADLRR